VGQGILGNKLPAAIVGEQWRSSAVPRNSRGRERIGRRLESRVSAENFPAQARTGYGERVVVLGGRGLVEHHKVVRALAGGVDNIARVRNIDGSDRVRSALQIKGVSCRLRGGPGVSARVREGHAAVARPGRVGHVRVVVHRVGLVILGLQSLRPSWPAYQSGWPVRLVDIVAHVVEQITEAVGSIARSARFVGFGKLPSYWPVTRISKFMLPESSART